MVFRYYFLLRFNGFFFFFCRVKPALFTGQYAGNRFFSLGAAKISLPLVFVEDAFQPYS